MRRTDKSEAQPDGAPEGTRTPGLLLRRQLLYPAELLAPVQKQAHRFNAVERVMGIEPTRPAWKAGVLPLNYTRIYQSDASYFSKLSFACQARR